MSAINNDDFKAIEGIQELKSVRSSRSSINWAVWYIKKGRRKTIVKFDDAGPGGLNDLRSRLDEDKIQMFLFRVTGIEESADVKSVRTKYVRGFFVGVRSPSMLKASLSVVMGGLEHFLGDAHISLQIDSPEQLSEVSVEKSLRAAGGAHQVHHYDFANTLASAVIDSPRRSRRRSMSTSPRVNKELFPESQKEGNVDVVGKARLEADDEAKAKAELKPSAIGYTEAKANTETKGQSNAEDNAQVETKLQLDTVNEVITNTKAQVKVETQPDPEPDAADDVDNSSATPTAKTAIGSRRKILLRALTWGLVAGAITAVVAYVGVERLGEAKDRCKNMAVECKNMAFGFRPYFSRSLTAATTAVVERTVVPEATAETAPVAVTPAPVATTSAPVAAASALAAVVVECKKIAAGFF